MVDSGGNGGDTEGNFMVGVTHDGGDRCCGDSGDGDGCLCRGYGVREWMVIGDVMSMV